MSDHPSTFRGDTNVNDAINWEDRAALHRASGGSGILDNATALRRGSFAEMIEHLMLLPAEDRGEYTIQKEGDREYSADEAAKLGALPDFPLRR